MNRRMALKLGDICEIVSGATPKTGVKSFWDGTIPWATPADLSNLEGAYITDTPRRLTEAGLVSCSAPMLPANSVLFSSRAPIGHVAINTVPMATNQGFKSLVPKTGLADAKFLFHWLRYNKAKLQSLGNGATFKEVSKAVVSEIGIDLPPLGEQRRIAAILDKADALRQKRKRAIALLDSLTQSIFAHMFGDVATNDRGWANGLALQDVAEIGSGITKGRPDKGRALRNVPYMAVANVQERHLDLTQIKMIAATEEEIKRFRLEPGDLLLTEGGDPDKLGRGTLWHGELPEAIHQNHIFRVRFDTDQVVPLFGNWLIGSERGKSYFMKSAKQTTGIASINKSQLSGFPMLMPPISIQRTFEAAAKAVAREHHALVAATDQVDILFASLQQRAFSGQL